MAVFPNEITKCNYQERLEEVTELIKISDFVAVDCTIETTGLLLQDETFNSVYLEDINDWIGTWYDTIKSKEKSHFLMEVGIAIFKRVPDSSKEIEVEIFNIPVLSACIDDNEIARFRGQNSARLAFEGYGQEFIKNAEFEVNKVFYMGTPYMNREMRERADEYMKKNPNFMVAKRKRRLNPYLMPQLYEEVAEEERNGIIDRLKGVAKVFETIIQCGTPLIGHHLLLKLMFIYKDFIEYLPDTYPECIDKLNDVFKVVYDSKQLAKDLKSQDHLPVQFGDQLKTSDLKLYELLRNLSKCSDGFNLNIGNRSELYSQDLVDLCEGDILEKDTDSFCYVAGFDALTCGLLFLDLVSVMEICKLDCGDEENQADCKDYLEMFLKGHATKFRNKIYEAPEIPDRDSCLFREIMHVKKFLIKKNVEKKQQEKEKICMDKRTELFLKLENADKNKKQSTTTSVTNHEQGQNQQQIDEISDNGKEIETSLNP